MTAHTSNPAAVANHETFTVRRTISIAAPVEKVWTAITQPQHVSRWFGALDLPSTRPGSEGTISWPEQSAVPIRVEAVRPHESITYRWCNDSATMPATVDDGPSTEFTFTLAPTDHGTQLTVVEIGFETSRDPARQIDEHREGWDGELDKLVALLEGASS